MYNKILLSIFVGLNSFIINSMAMESNVEPEKELPNQIVYASESYLENLPLELKQEIILLLKEDDLGEISKTLQNLSLVNKEYNRIINNPNFIGQFIRQYLGIIDDAFDQNSLWQIINFVNFLKLPGAYAWFENFINKNTSKIGSDGLNDLLHQAMSNKNIKMIKILLNQSLVDVNSLDRNGYPAIIKALPEIFKPYQESRSFEIANLLLAHPKIDINATISQNAMASREEIDPHAGYGLLHIAVDTQDINLLKFLLNIPRININLCNFFAVQTPLELAQELYNKADRLIKEEQAKVNVFDVFDQSSYNDSIYVDISYHEQDKNDLIEIIDLLKAKGANF